eukprot:3250912-Prymnesium_polylepis.1
MMHVQAPPVLSCTHAASTYPVACAWMWRAARTVDASAFFPSPATFARAPSLRSARKLWIGEV